MRVHPTRLWAAALLLVLANGCAGDEDADRSQDPYQDYVGNYRIEMELTEVNCPFDVGKASLNGSLHVYADKQNLYFDGPFLLDSDMFHEMRMTSDGSLEHIDHTGGRTFTLTADAQSGRLNGQVALEFPGCVARGRWSAERKP